MSTRDTHSIAVLVAFVAALVAGCSNPQSAFTITASAAAQSAVTPQAGDNGGWAEALNSDGATRLAVDYQAQCATAKPAATCEILRDLLVAEVSTALGLLERSRDQRGVDEALAGLEFPDEPDIFIPAARILGHFPTTPGIVEKALPQLENRFVEVQRIAATLLKAIPDVGAAQAGELWLHTHRNLPPGSVYEQYPDFPPHYAGMGFPKYPGAVWFSPADSDRSVGWSTTDDAAAVTRWFTESLRAEAMDLTQWQRFQADQLLQQVDQTRITRMQQLMEKAFKGDKAAMAEYEKLAKEMDTSNARDDADKAPYDIATPPDSLVTNARWIVAKKNGARASAVVVVFPLPGLKRTAIQFAWDLKDYPSAWPPDER